MKYLDWGGDVTGLNWIASNQRAQQKYVIESRDFQPIGFELRPLKTVTSNMAAAEDCTSFIETF